MRNAILVAVLSGAVLITGVAEARNSEIGQYLKRLDVPPAHARAAVVCHGFGCKFRTHVALNENDIRSLRAILGKGKASAAAELSAIGQAVAWFERRIGSLTGTSNRTPRAGPRHAGIRSEADCVDETVNTTQLLLVISELGLLRFHEAVGPESRGYLLDGRYPHNTAVVENVQNGVRWAIDPWPKRNGERPDVMRLERWLEGG